MRDAIDRITTNYAKAIAVLEISIRDMERILAMQKKLIAEMNFKKEEQGNGIS